MHVAYALLKGNTLEIIEGNTRKKLNHELIKKYIVKYTGSIELADSIDFSDPKAKAGGMYDVIKQLISEQADDVDDSGYNTSTAVMDLIKGGV
jgi:hypothetical protein